MAVSLSSTPAGKDRTYHFDPLKGSPARVSGFYPSLPNAQYMDVFKSTHNFFHPLKSLGRLVTETQTIMPFSFTGGAPNLFAQNGHQAAMLHEQVLNMASIPYFNKMSPIFPKPEEAVQMVSDHSTGSVSDFSSPSSEKSSLESCSPSKDNVLYLHNEPVTEQTRTYCFTDEDLFNVLYGYSRNQEKNVGHAISGVVLPGNSSEFKADASFDNLGLLKMFILEISNSRI